jgi:hypothetical protein
MRLHSQTAAVAEVSAAREALEAEIPAARDLSAAQSEHRAAASSDAPDVEDIAATDASALWPDERATGQSGRIALAVSDVATKMAQAMPPDDHATVPQERPRMNAEPLVVPLERSLKTGEVVVPQRDGPRTVAEHPAAIAVTATATAATNATTTAASTATANTTAASTTAASTATANTAAASTAVTAATEGITAASTAGATAEMRLRSQTAAVAEVSAARETLEAEIPAAQDLAASQPEHRSAASSDSRTAEDVAATEASALRPDELATVRAEHTALVVEDFATKVAQVIPSDDHAITPLEWGRMNAEPLAASPERSLATGEVVVSQPEEAETLAEQPAASAATASATTTTNATANVTTATVTAIATSAIANSAIRLRNQTAAAGEAALAVLLMRAESLGHVERLAAELMLQRLLRKDSGPLNGALETALSQPSAIARLTELAPSPVLAELLVRLQPALAAQLPSILRAVSPKAELAQVPAMQARSTWRTIYQAAFVAADPVTPAEFIRTLTHALGGPELAAPQPVAAATAPQEIMKRLLQPLTARADQAIASNVSPGSRAVKNEAEPLAQGDHNIRNAGMVIIATYAQRLFSILDLTKDGQFISEEAAERAVHLLQYAVTGASATPEYQLALNKLLCGIHGGLPIVPGIDLTDKEKDTIEQMLNGVIAHWKALGKTSIAGLRQTFLQREGQLHFEEEAWHLQIPSAIFDMLLDRLPWSFAMIKFPWMAHPLKVTWR